VTGGGWSAECLLQRYRGCKAQLGAQPNGSCDSPRAAVRALSPDFAHFTDRHPQDADIDRRWLQLASQQAEKPGEKRGTPWLRRGRQWHDRSSSFRAGQSGARTSAPRLPRRPPGQFGVEAGRCGAGDVWIEDRCAVAERVSCDPEPWAASAAGELTDRDRSRRPEVGAREGLRPISIAARGPTPGRCASLRLPRLLVRGLLPPAP
jgi:hypothetical protein